MPTEKLDKSANKIEKLSNQWKCRHLTMFGRSEVIKTYLLPKIRFLATMLCVTDDIIQKLKNVIYGYLWGKRDNVKRSTTSHK